MAEKTRLTAGADERTPSRSEYFSWINNTNEGSTEARAMWTGRAAPTSGPTGRN